MIEINAIVKINNNNNMNNLTEDMIIYFTNLEKEYHMNMLLEDFELLTKKHDAIAEILNNKANAFSKEFLTCIKNCISNWPSLTEHAKIEK